MDCLMRGYVFESKLGQERYFAKWYDEVSTELLYASYVAFSKDARDRDRMSRETFGRFMTRMGCKNGRLSDVAVGEHITNVENIYGGTTRKTTVLKRKRAWGYKVGDLAAARAAFENETKLNV